jgi:hypothetical protein
LEGELLTLATLVPEVDNRVVLDPILLEVTRELTLVAAEIVLVRIGTTAGLVGLRSTVAIDTVRGGVLLLGSTFGLTDGLEGVNVVAEIVRVRTVRPGGGPGLRLLLLWMVNLGLRRPAGEPAAGLFVAALVTSPVLRLERDVKEGWVLSREPSLGLSFLYVTR